MEGSILILYQPSFFSFAVDELREESECPDNHFNFRVPHPQ